MLPLFRKPKRSETTPNNAQDKLAETIVRTCLCWQDKWASWMQRKTMHVSRKTKLIVLFTFISLTGGYNLYLIARSFLTKQTTILSINAIKTPEHVLRSSDEVLKRNAIIMEKELQSIQQFKLYMDSLAHSPTGKNLFDSINTARPGLMDSILIIENIYLSHKLNSK